MSMPKREFDLIEEVAKYVAENHGQLNVVFPNSDTFQLGNTVVTSPDMVITNPVNQHVLGIEIKEASHLIPTGEYPNVKSMHDGFRNANEDFLMISLAPVSGVFSSNIAANGISWIDASGSDDFFPKFEEKLREFETRSTALESVGAN